MTKVDFKSVDQYIAAQPAPAQDSLRRVRNTILEALPKAEETISYGMPTYKLHGEAVLYFAAWKQHYSLYPASGRLLAAFQGDLTEHEVKKSTIRFRFSRPVPAKLIARIAKFRAKEVAGREKNGRA